MLMQLLWRPDVVLLIEPTLFCAPQALLVARIAGGIAWLHVQDFEVDVAFRIADFSSRLLRDLAHSIERLLMRRFNRVSTISDRMIEKLSDKEVKIQQRVLFPNWVNTSEIYPLPSPSPLRQTLGIAADAIVALYAGNMGLKQGLDVLIRASKQLASQRGICFVFCGDGPYRETLVQKLGKAANVKFLPLQPADRLNELLNLADIHLLPQLADAADLVMPSKLTGIMASGRPVVATADEGTQLAVVVAGRGLITAPGHVDAFARAVSRLAYDHGLRLQMGEEARAYATTHLNRDDVLLRFERSLMDACGATQFILPPRQAKPDTGPSID